MTRSDNETAGGRPGTLPPFARAGVGARTAARFGMVAARWVLVISAACPLPNLASAQDARPRGPQAEFKVAIVSSIGEEGPRFLELRPADFNPAGLFTTNDAKTFKVALSLNRQSHALAADADPAVEESALVKLASALERVAAVRVLVAMPSQRHSMARVWHKDGAGWKRLDVPGPKARSAAALQRWLEKTYGYPAWVRDARGGTVTLRISPSVAEGGAGRRQALLLRGAAGKPLGDPTTAEPVALLSCVPRGTDAACERVLERGDGAGADEATKNAGAIAPGTPVWFP